MMDELLPPPRIATIPVAASWGKDFDILMDALNFHHSGDLEQALALYLWLAGRHPDNADLHFNLGACHQERRHLSQAVREYRVALSLNGNLVAAHESLARVLRDQGRLSESAASYRHALSLEVDNIEALDGLASTLKAMKLYDEAIDAVQHSLKVRPDKVRALILLGTLYYEKGEIALATKLFRQALVVDPEQAQAHFNLSQCLLLTGDLSEGWREHEWRGGIGALVGNAREFPVPAWQGEPLVGKTVLLHVEQGLGDSIQFVRYTALFRAMGARVVMECQPQLSRLFSCIKDIDVLVIQGQALPYYDCHASLLSLPYLFGTNLTTVPTRMPYLEVEAPGGVDLSLLGLSKDRLRVGIVWSGNPNHSNDHNRSIRFGLFETIVRDFSSQVDFISVQVGDRRNERSSYLWADNMFDLAPHLDDFADTAEALVQIDLLISVDTSTAHLAGALALPVWLLLPYVPDSRWLLAREDTPWYPSTRIFRQPANGDWDAVFGALYQCFAEWLAASHPSGSARG